MGEEFGTRLTWWSWLRVSQEVAEHMAAEAASSEGLTGLGWGSWRCSEFQLPGLLPVRNLAWFSGGSREV